MFILRWEEGLLYQQVFDARRAAFHALMDHGQTPAVQAEARRLLRDLLLPLCHPISPVDDGCNQMNGGPNYYGWAALYFVIALGLLGIVYACWLARRRIPIVPIAVVLVLTSIWGFGMGVRSLYDAMHLPTVELCHNVTQSPGIEWQSSSQESAQSDDPEWDAATDCEKSWVDKTCDDLPHRYPIEFCGKHYRIPREYWRDPNRYLSPERLHQILTSAPAKPAVPTEGKEDKPKANGYQEVSPSASDR